MAHIDIYQCLRSANTHNILKPMPFVLTLIRLLLLKLAFPVEGVSLTS